MEIYTNVTNGLTEHIHDCISAKEKLVLRRN